MELGSIFVGFVTGVLLALAGAWINISLTRKSESRSTLEAAEYEMYLKLNELYNWYFWFSANELHQQETSQEVVDETYKIASDLARLLHANERTEFASDLIKILYDERYPTYDARWKHISALSDRVGSKVVPVHIKHLRELGESNIHLMAENGFVAKAPASSRFKLRV